MGPSRTPHSPGKAEPNCLQCLDLNYSLFTKLTPDDYHSFRRYFLQSESLRYHVVSFEALAASALGKCENCRTLHQGITALWINAETDHGDENQVEDDPSAGTPPHILLALRPGLPLQVCRGGTELTERPRRILLHSRILPALEFYSDKYALHSLAAFGCARHVPGSLSFDHCMSILKDWLQDCNANHTACFPSSTPNLPPRLLEISSIVPRLIETEPLVYTNYATLSHCWGDIAHMIKTTRDTFEERKAGISLDELPQLFREAIEIARGVGCRYIWIDSLCIIQDDFDDWKRAAKLMADIYSHSYLNIATTFSPSSAGSCFTKRKILEVWSHKEYPVEDVEVVSQDDNITTGVKVRVAHTTGHEHLLGQLVVDRKVPAPLLERAWVFQERLLARRTLHFGCSEMIWECNSCVACECGQIPEKATEYIIMPEAGNKESEDRSMTTIKINFAAIALGRVTAPRRIVSTWLDMVYIYVPLSLTHASDRPHALAGLASRIAEHINCEYLAGMWREYLPCQLAWYTAHCVNGARRRLPPPIPTWSWMSPYEPSYNGCLIQNFSDPMNYVPCPSLEIPPSETFCKWDPLNPFGTIVSAQLGLSSAAMVGVIKIMQGDDGDCSDYYVHASSGGSPSGNALLDCPTADGVTDGQAVLLLFLGSSKPNKRTAVEAALLLKPVEGELGDGLPPPTSVHAYTRVGVAWFDVENRLSSQDAEVRHVRVM